MKILEITPKEGLNINHRKEKNFMHSYILVICEDNKMKEIAEMRIYGTNAMNYACLWVHDSKNDIYCNGSGRAGGYGYHRPSAAASDAFLKAGIKLSESISGRGGQMIGISLNALAKHLGYENIMIIEAHG